MVLGLDIPRMASKRPKDFIRRGKEFAGDTYEGGHKNGKRRGFGIYTYGPRKKLGPVATKYVVNIRMVVGTETERSSSLMG